MRPLVLLGVAIVALTVPAVAAGDVVAVITADRDNTIYSESGSLSNAKGPDMPSALTNSGKLRRALVHFDLSSIPAGATITSVSVEMRVINLSVAGRSTSGVLHRLTSDWGEGGSNAGSAGGEGAPATPGDATWTDNFFGSSTWTTPGGDFVVAVSSSIVPAIGPVVFPSTPELVADVQLMVDDPGSNFGWLLRAQEIFNGSGVLYRTRESVNPPEITVHYTVDAFEDLGRGLAGTVGTPQLAGQGELLGNDPVTFSLTNALPGGSASFVVGLAYLGAPLKGGLLVPSVDVLLQGLPIDGAGELLLPLTWPAGLPSGSSLYYQVWIPDAGGVHGFAASNGLKSTTP